MSVYPFLSTDKAITKFFLCKKKLHSFTEEELNALPKAFLVYVAANAVKEIWDRVPKAWMQDPMLAQLQPCTVFDHHQQVNIGKIPSVMQCSTCKLLKLYHGQQQHKSDLVSFVNTYHGCEAEGNWQRKQEAKKAEEDETPCWAWHLG